MKKQKIVKPVEDKCNGHIKEAIKAAKRGDYKRLAMICAGMHRAIVIAKWSCGGSLTTWAKGVKAHYEELLEYLEPFLDSEEARAFYAMILSKPSMEIE